MMAHLLPRRVPYVCKACRGTQTPQLLFRSFATTHRRRTTLQEQLSSRTADSKDRTGRKVLSKDQDEAAQRQLSANTPSSASAAVVNKHNISDPKQALRNIQEEALTLLEASTIPDEDIVVDLLLRAQQLADVLGSSPSPEKQSSQRSPLFTVLSEESPRKTSAVPISSTTATATELDSNRGPLALQLVKTLYTLLEDPKVFISETLLRHYVHMVTALALPQYLPKIFHLYAHKPVPIRNTQPTKFDIPWSRAPKYAIPSSLADKALDSAIARRDLPLCISIIDVTVSTPQFKSAKFIRRAALPLLGSASVIPLAYSLSSRAAAWQVSWDPETFWWMCMTGAGAYLGTMGTLLLITVTTWNDHHRRVRWVPGTPLGRRWFREEERAMFDRVALAWGYEDENRHGEETGEEWEALREELALRYLELDRSSLLPGML